jgi:hypothetical protein
MKKEISEYDMHCNRCGKHVDELIPFDLKNEVGAHNCAERKLGVIFRELDLVDYNEECENIVQQMSDGIDINELKKLHGPNKVQSALLYESLIGNLEKSFECRDCIQEEGLYKRYSGQ